MTDFLPLIFGLGYKFYITLKGLKSTKDDQIQKVCRSFPSLSSLTLCDNIEITDHSIISGEFLNVFCN